MDPVFSTNDSKLMDSPLPLQANECNPFVQKVKPLRRHRVLIDSTFRTSGSTVTDYSYEMDVPYFGVEKIELARAFFPNSLYLITDSNHTFTFLAGGVFTFDIPNGNYTNTELATAIEDGMNASGAGPVWTVVHNTADSTMTITSSTIGFSILGATMPLLAPIIGFGAQTYLSTGTTLTSPFPMNTAQPQNITLSIGDGSDTFDSLIVPTNASSDNIRCFSYIPLGISSAASLQESAATVGGSSIIVAGSGNMGGHGYFYIPKDATNSYYDFYEGSLGAIKRLQIKIRQVLSDGTVVVPNFNNANHIIEIEIISRTDKNSYTV